MSTQNNRERSSTNGKLFFTTTDLMNKLNETFAVGTSSSTDNDSLPHFELQRRLPDGSTRKATPADQQLADMQSKFQQVAAEVKDLTDENKLVWAELQRTEGNRLYQQKKYQEAMDVYLTCLIVKSESNLFMKTVFLPCLNNLAQCTLQLGMYHKTEMYCTIALEELVQSTTTITTTNTATTTTTTTTDEYDPLVAKLYFRRGKARRLGGKYTLANEDLQKTLTMVTNTKPVVYRELHLLEQAMVESKRNETRQERAMQQIWKTSTTPKSSSLYDNVKQRTFSNLRAKRKSDDDLDERINVRENLSYWAYYMAVIARLAEHLLVLTGDEETIDHINGEKED
jgi:hypothetical protein